MSTKSSTAYWVDEETGDKIHVYYEYMDDRYHIEISNADACVEMRISEALAKAISVPADMGLKKEQP